MNGITITARAQQILDMFLDDHEVPEELLEDLQYEIEAGLQELINVNPTGAAIRQGQLYDRMERYLENWVEENTEKTYYPKYTYPELVILGGFVDAVPSCGVLKCFQGCYQCPVSSTCPLA